MTGWHRDGHFAVEAREPGSTRQCLLVAAPVRDGPSFGLDGVVRLVERAHMLHFAALWLE